MGRGLGPTQRKVLDFLEQQWTAPDPVIGPMVPQAAVADALATTYSEAQAIRRAIRTLKDRKLIGTAHMRNDFDCWLVPQGENGAWDDPRPRAQGKLPRLRDAIADLLTPDWQQVQEIRRAVLGDRPGRAERWEGAHQWDRDRQLFNRALSQLCRDGVAQTVGRTHGYLQQSWKVRKLSDWERDLTARKTYCS